MFTSGIKKNLVPAGFVVAVTVGFVMLYNCVPRVSQESGPLVGPGRAANGSSTWFTQTAPRPPSPAKTVQAPISEQIEKLLATGKPDNAFRAYSLVESCIYFEKWHTLPLLGWPNNIHEMTDEERNDQVALCSGLTERMKTSRLDHLAFAASAGVQGADSAFLKAGPFGDPSALVSRPDDPLVKAWKQQAISQLTARAADADVGSLTTLYFEYLNGSEVVEANPDMALTYGAALRAIHSQFGLGETMNPFSETGLRGIESKMSQERIAAATRAADKIVTTWRAHRAIGR